MILARDGIDGAAGSPVCPQWIVGYRVDRPAAIWLSGPHDRLLERRSSDAGAGAGVAELARDRALAQVEAIADRAIRVIREPAAGS